MRVPADFTGWSPFCLVNIALRPEFPLPPIALYSQVPKPWLPAHYPTEPKGELPTHQGIPEREFCRAGAWRLEPRESAMVLAWEARQWRLPAWHPSRRRPIPGSIRRDLRPAGGVR